VGFNPRSYSCRKAERPLIGRRMCLATRMPDPAVIAVVVAFAGARWLPPDAASVGLPRWRAAANARGRWVADLGSARATRCPTLRQHRAWRHHRWRGARSSRPGTRWPVLNQLPGPVGPLSCADHEVLVLRNWRIKIINLSGHATYKVTRGGLLARPGRLPTDAGAGCCSAAATRRARPGPVREVPGRRRVAGPSPSPQNGCQERF